MNYVQVYFYYIIETVPFDYDEKHQKEELYNAILNSPVKFPKNMFFHIYVLLFII